MEQFLFSLTGCSNTVIVEGNRLSKQDGSWTRL
jgi:hypothetical protein